METNFSKIRFLIFCDTSQDVSFIIVKSDRRYQLQPEIVGYLDNIFHVKSIQQIDVFFYFYFLNMDISLGICFNNEIMHGWS